MDRSKPKGQELINLPFVLHGCEMWPLALIGTEVGSQSGFTQFYLAHGSATLAEAFSVFVDTFNRKKPYYHKIRYDRSSNGSR
jgi:hypothetical protein